MKLTKFALAATMFAGTAGSLFAQDTFSAKDKVYLKDAAQSDMAEMSMAQLALQKSSNDDIKSYANQMMADHQKTSDAAKPVAEKAGVPMPADVNPKQKAQYTKLQGLSGTQFDNAYVKANVLDHRMILKKGKAEAATTQNSDMKTLTAMQEPIITDHTQKAEDLAKKMGSNKQSAPSDKSGM